MPGDPTEKRVLEFIADHYGLAGSLERLPGENLNYLLRTRGGERYVAKIVDEHMPPSVVEMESMAVEHAISRGFPLDLPQTIVNHYGNIETGIVLHNNRVNRLRIISFIDGIVLENMSDISTNLLKNLGESLARFHRVMSGFDHPAARRSHRWNLAEAGRHAPTANRVDDPEKRGLLEWAFTAWRRVEGALEALPWQFIHGDMNRENILVRGDRVTGLVDFGDSGMNPAVCDLAICLAYLMMDREDPLETASVISGAYHAVRPLGAAERAAVLPLVCGRLAVSIAVSTQRREIDPDHPNWFGSESSAWALLRLLRSRDAEGIPGWS